MLIRPEHAQDIDAIRQLTAIAFAAVEYSNQTEPAIIDTLRDAKALTLSLVAVSESDEIIGHIAFSPVTIDGGELGWFGLGPVSVHPDQQRRGVGEALVRQGLDTIRQTGAAGCVLLGDPGYYRRFGFENDSRLRYPLAPPEYFMQLAFGDAVPSGAVSYHPAFGG